MKRDSAMLMMMLLDQQSVFQRIRFRLFVTVLAVVAADFFLLGLYVGQVL